MQIFYADIETAVLDDFRGIMVLPISVPIHDRWRVMEELWAERETTAPIGVLIDVSEPAAIG